MDPAAAPALPAAPTAPAAAADLPDDVAVLKQMVLELLATLHEERRDKDALRQRLDLLLRRLYGPRSERFDPSQPLLFDADTPHPESATTPAPEATSRPRRRCTPHGRRPLPANLPRRIVHHELTATERRCSCGQVRVPIGVETSEQLDWQPASLFVWQHCVHKYACPGCAHTTAGTAPVGSGHADSGAEHAPPDTVTEKGDDNSATGSGRADSAATVAPTALPGGTTSVGDAATATRVAQDGVFYSTTTHSVADGPAAATTPAAGGSGQGGICDSTTAHSAADGPAVAPAAGGSGQGGVGDSTKTSPAADAARSAESGSDNSSHGPVVVAATKPAGPIARGLPGPGLLANLIVNKYVDHLPLYRQERIYQRQGVLLPRSTTCDWLAASAELLTPLYDLMVCLVLQARWLHTDDTTVKNQQPAAGETATARLWAYLGDASHPYNVFDFTTTRKRDGPQHFLTGFRGYLHADAFGGYDALYLPVSAAATPVILEVACNAHARRKFYEARSSDALRAHQALAFYGQLYEIERQARERDEAQRLRMRQELALPILDRFKVWLDAQRAAVLPKSPLAEAIGYALNNWSALIRYTEAGFLSIDNNVAEREMKRIAIGRKNWLHVGSAQGGRTAAVLFSFTSSCQRLQVEPWAYLQDVLSRLPTTPREQLAVLLPDRWQAARTPPDPLAGGGPGADPPPTQDPSG